MLMKGEYVAHFLYFLWYFQGLSKYPIFFIKIFQYIFIIFEECMEMVNLFYNYYSSTAGFIENIFLFSSSLLI